jgi:hypothetical protein
MGQAALCELDAYALAHNFGDVLTQRAEHYYHKLDAAPQPAGDGAGIASAHDRVAFKDAVAREDTAGCAAAPALPRCLAPPRRRAGLAAIRGRRVQGPADERRFAAPLDGGEVVKTYTLAGRVLQVAYRLRDVPGGRFSVELNLAMPSCDGYSGRYILEDGSIPCGFGQALELAVSQRLTLDDRVLGGGLR